jgi:excisionase family DNA binding protein
MKRIEKDTRGPYSVEEAAAKAGLDDKTVRKGIEQGQIRAVRIGRRVLIPRGPFDRLVEEGEPP